MTPPTSGPQSTGQINLPLLVLARVCTTVIFMTYPACLSVLLVEWQMTATRGGIVQGVFTAAFAVSLLVASFLCDRIGARRIFALANLLSAAAALLFALFARSFESALVCVALMGLAQGGTYTPAIMLVSANTAAQKKASAIGWVLAGMSAGYVISIFLSTALLSLYGYETAFLWTALATVLGWGLGYVAVRQAQDQVSAGGATGGAFDLARRRRSRLLTLGYIGHCWELFGAWAWIPAFLAAAVLSRGTMSAIELGLWTALALHLSGFFASFLSGYAADRFGARAVLIAFAVLGALCSLSIGWLSGAGVTLLLVIAAVYGFATIGDSSVLSSAMTDAVPPEQLGRVLGLRSVLGVGAGALSPAVFGLALDLTPGPSAWGYAFTTLAVGGAVAILCAVLLPRKS
ncbi:MFS transporter [Pelagibius sp.]|uniref:MFS transporter n=1 Tax=Pelagibius sp. TaxID=1931238 RepID=UPI00261DBBD0|nr:MFS transporter [Pelagibius sp.]